MDWKNSINILNLQPIAGSSRAEEGGKSLKAGILREPEISKKYQAIKNDLQIFSYLRDRNFCQRPWVRFNWF